MANVTAGQTLERIVPDQSLVLLNVVGTGTSADTIVITLGSHGIKSFVGIIENVHSTDSSVIVPVAPDHSATTSVSSGVLTITLGTGATGYKHNFLIMGRS